jgi:Exopolysaccharide biosynthesis protein related to N-acetylglucosamine-1-phosphodiester alpha-N-acetylglucosaminidase
MLGKNRILFVLTALIMTLFSFGFANADVKPIPLDMLEHGTPPKTDGWKEGNKEYEDESIHVVLNERRNYKSKSSDGGITIHWAEIEIKDPSQLRTALSYDSFENKKAATAPEMVAYLNPVVAFNDDYCKMNIFKGYVVRQGVLCKDDLDEWAEERKQDVLVIDDSGDCSAVLKASSAEVRAHISQLESQGKKAVNIFTFGPVLILDGEIQTVDRSTSTHSLNLAVARTVFCQIGPLKYAVFAADAPQTGYGINCQELANFISQIYPDCRIAYNLDGGGSSRLFMGQKRINKAQGRREIYGMIYFASAVSGKE